MAQGEDLQHHYIRQTALPYVSNGSPTDKDVVFTVSSANILTSIRGYAERRGGFGYHLADTAFTFSGTLQRFFTWRRWTGASITLSGAYFVMYNDTGAGASRVWKQRVGTDALPVLLHTDSTSTGIFDFVASNNFLFFGNGVDMQKWDGTTKSNWGITAPSAAVTFSSGSGALSPVIGFQWVISFENNSTTHMSSPSAASASSGVLTSVQFTLTGNTTTDAQVDRVRVFRTIDGGSIYFEHPSSPVVYSTWTASGLVDNSADSALTTSVAPLPNQNNRPTASFGPVWFANRIWTFVNDTLYYSDFEELVRGVEEECFASVNLRSFGREIVALAIANSYLLIFTSDIIFRIYGDSLATFHMDKLADGKGALNRGAVVAFDNYVAWLDSSNTVWITDGSTLRELSQAIRPDIVSITHSLAAMAYHRTGNAHWLILMDGGAERLRVYDIDNQQWMPPWVIANITAIYSGQTGAGTHRLFLGRSGTPLFQGTAYQDAGSNYTAVARLNLFDLVPEENPSMYGILDHVAIERNSTALADVRWLTDEDPENATYTIAEASQDPPNRTQGTNLVESWYMTRSDDDLRGARRVSIELNWAAANSNFEWFGAAIAYEPVE